MTFTLLILIVSLCAHAQPNWDVYTAQYDKGMGSVMLDMSLKAKAPVKKLPWLVVTGVTFNYCDEHGLPGLSAMPTLYAISDSLQVNMNKHGENINTGSFTYQCQRLDYYYVTDTVNLRKQLLQFYRQKFPSYAPYINFKKDTSWSGYLKFLYPGDAVLEHMQNEKIVFKLQKAGDKLDKARIVDHFIYFKNKEDLTCFWFYANTYGFKLESQDNTGDAEKPWQLHISRMDKVDLASIDQLTILLRREAGKCHGVYDGWETVVVKQ
jgi:hypothetical protein